MFKYSRKNIQIKLWVTFGKIGKKECEKNAGRQTTNYQPCHIYPPVSKDTPRNKINHLPKISARKPFFKKFWFN